MKISFQKHFHFARARYTHFAAGTTIFITRNNARALYREEWEVVVRDGVCVCVCFVLSKSTPGQVCANSSQRLMLWWVNREWDLRWLWNVADFFLWCLSFPKDLSKGCCGRLYECLLWGASIDVKILRMVCGHIVLLYMRDVITNEEIIAFIFFVDL